MQRRKVEEAHMHRRLRVPPLVLARARELRREQTPMELRLWEKLRHRQLGGLRFRRQHPIGRFIVDFYCPAHRLVIEIDGAVHGEQVERDQSRTAWLEEHGCKVLRFPNDDVRDELDRVLDSILRAASSGG